MSEKRGDWGRFGIARTKRREGYSHSKDAMWKSRLPFSSTLLEPMGVDVRTEYRRP
jgi:hypothetical protein